MNASIQHAVIANKPAAGATQAYWPYRHPLPTIKKNEKAYNMSKLQEAQKQQLKNISVAEIKEKLKTLF